MKRVDGILLALHGAMVAEGYPDGEGALLETLRDKVGTEVPIIASLDLHCNLTKKMVKYADAFSHMITIPIQTPMKPVFGRPNVCGTHWKDGFIRSWRMAFGFSAHLYAYRRTMYGKVRGESTEDQQ